MCNYEKVMLCFSQKEIENFKVPKLICSTACLYVLVQFSVLCHTFVNLIFISRNRLIQVAHGKSVVVPALVDRSTQCGLKAVIKSVGIWKFSMQPSVPGPFC